MSIQLVTYANQTVTPTNDAIIYERAIDQNGIFYGCNVTVSGNEVHITGGYGIVCGREFTIQSEAITVTLAPSGTLDGRLYVRLDLADADDPIQLLTATGNTLPPLEQDDDVNYTNGTYEMELATFTVGVSALSDVVETFEIIEGSKHRLVNMYASKFVGITAVSLAQTDKNIVLSASGTATSNANFDVTFNGGVTINETGLYLVSFGISFNSLGNSGNTLTSSLRKYASGAMSTLDTYGITHTGAYFTFSAPTLLYAFNAGDVLFISARNNTSATGSAAWGVITVQRVE